MKNRYLKPVVRHAVGADEVHAVGLEHSRDLHAHFGNVRGGPLSAQHRVQGALVDNSVEGLVWEVQRADVHQQPTEGWPIPKGGGVHTEGAGAARKRPNGKTNRLARWV